MNRYLQHDGLVGIRCVKLLILLLIKLFSPQANLQAANWYVDSAISIQGDGRSWNTAFKTIAALETALAPGDTAWLKPGDYSNEILKITNKLSITIKIAPDTTGEAVIGAISIYGTNGATIDGFENNNQRIALVHANNSTGLVTGASASIASQAWVRSSRNILLRGLQTQRATVFRGDTKQVHGIQIDNLCDLVVVEHCNIASTSGDGINTGVYKDQLDDSATHGIYRNNVITGVADDGIQSSYGGFTAVDNYLNNAGQPAMLGGHPDGIQVNPQGTNRSANLTGARNIVIARNKIRFFNQQIFLEYTSGNVKVYNNELIGWRPTDEVAASLGGYSNTGIVGGPIATANGTYVYSNNTFFNFVVGSAILGNWSAVDPNNTKGNLFVNCKVICSSFALDDTNVRFDTPGNIWYDSAKGLPQSFSDSNRYFGNTKLLDPKLNDYSTEDLRPRIDSLIRGISPNLSVIFNDDRTSNLRPPSGNWDTGALQFRDIAVVAPTSANLSIKL